MSDLLEARAAEPARSAVRASGYAAALGLTAAATWIAVLTDLGVHIPNLSLIFMLPVVVAAVGFGRGPALASAVAGAVCFNFFLIEPRFTFRVADPSNVWALGLLLLVAVIVSALAARARRQALEALEHAHQARALQGLAQALAAATDRRTIMDATAQTLNAVFGSPAVVILVGDEDRVVSSAPPSAQLSHADQDAAALALASRQPTRGDAYPVEAARFDFWPVVTRSRIQAVIGVGLAQLPNRPAAPETLVQAVAGYLSVSLDREVYAREAVEARLETESERVKADVLAAVSHDLRTPLSTILVTLQSLQRFGDAHDADTRRELLRLAELETSRLAALVNGLLDMGRLEVGALAVRPEPVAPAALAASALRRVEGALADRTVINETPQDLPAVLVDPALAETALANVLENAGKYGGAGSTVTIRGAVEGTAALIEVLDEGPGFPEGVEAMFGKFSRGVQGDGRPPGVGLGLAIARGFLRAQGADVDARNRSDRSGASVRLFLPLAPWPPE